MSRTSFYTVFQYWSNQRRKENHRYQENLGDQNGFHCGRKITEESFLITAIKVMTTITAIIIMIIIEAIAAI